MFTLSWPFAGLDGDPVAVAFKEEGEGGRGQGRRMSATKQKKNKLLEGESEKGMQCESIYQGCHCILRSAIYKFLSVEPAADLLEELAYP